MTSFSALLKINKAFETKRKVWINEEEGKTKDKQRESVSCERQKRRSESVLRDEWQNDVIKVKR